MKKILLFTFVFALILHIPVISKPEKKNKTKYEPYKPDEVLEQIEKNRKDMLKKQDMVTEKIISKHRSEKKAQRTKRKVLKADLSGVYPPKALESFKTLFHFPPVPQYYTSTCWSFGTTSFYESEIYRLTGKKVKLSEMWTPYYEYIEKAMRFIRERGNSYVAGGAQSNSLKRIWEKYGILPDNAYSGLTHKVDKHDHNLLMKELRRFLNFIKENDLWNEAENRKHIELIVNKYMGKPPESFTYDGKTWAPQEFLKHTGLKLDDYYSLMSTSYFPFYTMQEFKVPDNWWHSKEYINVPLNTWYQIIKKSIKSGYTVVIGGDVSEPGKLGSHDIAFIPTFDIPGKYINQDSREYRIYNKTTDDDHAIHLVGHTRLKGKDWFLVKDSGRSARKGKHKGYYFFRGDFIKLKMLTFMVHKDMLKEILPRIKK